jgi:hypothetical protein
MQGYQGEYFRCHRAPECNKHCNLMQHYSAQYAPVHPVSSAEHYCSNNLLSPVNTARHCYGAGIEITMKPN